jgi:hypothetical protein
MYLMTEKELIEELPKVKEKPGFLYQNQIDLAQSFIKSEWKTKNSLVTAETQAGKTGVMFAIMQNIADHAWMSEEVVENEYEFVLWSPPDKDLEKQTRERIEKFPIEIMDRTRSNHVRRIKKQGLADTLFGHGKEENFLNSQRTRAINKMKKKINLNENKTFIIFVDEAHFGQGSDSKFEDFMNFCENKRNTTFVYITATPSPFVGEVERLEDLRKKFNLFYLNPAPCYYSMQNCFDEGRIIDIEESLNLDKKCNFNNWIDKILIERLIKVDNRDDGFFIVRVPNSKVAKKLEEAIEKRKIEIFKDHYVNVYANVYSSENRNINEVSDKLENYVSQTSSIKVMIICQALGQGKTIETGGIIGWYEYLNTSRCGKYNNEAKLIQSIGRNFGNNVQNRGYPIWTHQGTIERALLQYNEMKIISSNKTLDSYSITILNKQTSTHVKSIGPESKQTIDKKTAKFFYSKEEVQDFLDSKGYLAKYTIKSSSENNKNDLCGVLLGLKTHSSFICGLEQYGLWIVNFDGPNPNHLASWDLIENKYKNKIALFQIDRYSYSKSKNESIQKIA